MSDPNNQLRTRRSRDEIRKLILDAARESFAIKGFAATTREIAERATVTEQLLFNHFESKQQLYAVAVVQPFEKFVETQLDAWQATVPAATDVREMMHEYVDGLYRLVLQHKTLFRALHSDAFGAHVEPILDRLEAISAEIAARDGYTFDPHIAVRIVFAAVTTLALHQDQKLRSRGDEDIINELAATLAAGLDRRD
jgi:AcrR family transcriptional regulator